jgi:radical SAM superfamily enzyme YgiQ (UPF0313 family)
MSKEVILVNPEFPGSVLRPCVPAGLLTVAGHVDKFGLPVRLHDESIMGKYVPDNVDGALVGITAMSAQVKRAKEIAIDCQEAGAHEVIFGGIHPTVRPEEMKKYGAVLKGEIEGGSLEEALIDYVNNRLSPEYLSPLMKLENIPLAPQQAYKLSNRGQWEIVSNARGCPMGCDYCTVCLVAGRKIRARPIEEVIKEMRIRGLFTGINRLVTFATDTFGTKKDRVLLTDIKPEIENKEFNWLGQIGIQTFNDDNFLELASSVGTANLAVGIESPFRRKLAGVKKGIKGINPIKAFEKVRKYPRIKTNLLLMVGFDWEPKNRFEEISGFVNKLQPDLVYLSILTPLPGSRTAEQLEGEDRIVDRDWSLYDTRHLVFEPKFQRADGSFGTMSRQDFMEGFNWLKEEIVNSMLAWSNRDRLLEDPLR